MPATRALSNSSPEALESRPTTTVGGSVASARSTPTAARPRARASSGVRSAFASPRTPSVPNSLPIRETRLALGVLGRLAGLLQPVLLALHLAGVAGQEAPLLQLRPQLLVEVDQGAGDAVAQRAGLPGDPAAVEVGHDVVALERVGDPQRLGHQPAVGRVGELVLERAVIQLERAGPLEQPYPDDGLLAASGAAGQQGWSSQQVSSYPSCLAAASRPRSSGRGSCAACGWVGPSYTFSSESICRPTRLRGSMPRTAVSTAREGR